MSDDAAFAAELYELVHRGNAGDVDHYRRVCDGADSVLELGCGYGRLLGPLLRDGHRVVGLDIDPAMLARASRNVGVADSEGAALRLVLGEMSSFDLGERFDRVIVPYNGLFCLENADLVEQCFGAARRHLTPGGLFAFDCYSADGLEAAADPAELEPQDPELLSHVETAARRYAVFETLQHIPSERCFRARYDYRPLDTGAAHRSEIMHHYLESHELVALLHRAGRWEIGLSGDFRGAEFNADSQHLIVVARSVA